MSVISGRKFPGSDGILRAEHCCKYDEINFSEVQ